MEIALSCPGLARLASAALVAAVVLWPSALPARAAEKPTVRPYLPTASCYYVRAEKGRAWRVRFNAPVTVPPGIGLIVHDKEGVIRAKTLVPPGEYSPQTPYDVAVPAAGADGDYRIVLSGHSANLNPQVTPLTDLAREVFSGPTLSMPHYTPPLYFVTPGGVDKITISSRAQKLDIRKPDKSAPPMSEPVQDELNYKIEVQVGPGVHYWIRPVGFMGFYPTAYFAYAPERLFAPDPAFEKLKWWRLFDDVK